MTDAKTVRTRETAAITRASTKDSESYEELTYEGFGNGGVSIYIEAASDNPTRTVANVRSYFNKCNGNLGTSGSVEFMFDHTCNFRVSTEELKMDIYDNMTLMFVRHLAQSGKSYQLNLDQLTATIENIFDYRKVYKEAMEYFKIILANRKKSDRISS